MLDILLICKDKLVVWHHFYGVALHAGCNCDMSELAIYRVGRLVGTCIA